MKVSTYTSKFLMRAILGRGPEDEEQLDESGEVVGTDNDARLKLYDQIADGNDKARGEEFVEYDENEKPVPFSVGEEAPPKEEQEAAPVLEEQEPAPAKLVRKVNGKDVEITDELLEKAQKIAAADAYLEEARKAKQQAHAEVHAAPVAQKNPEEEDLELARAIQMGTEEEAVAALRKLRQREPAITPDVIAQQIDGRLAFNNAYSNFCKDYKDIVGDVRLKSMAEQMDQQLIQNGDTRTYEERFTEIGNDLRNWVKSKAAPATASNELAKKEDRKAAAPTVPKATNGKHVVQAEEEKEESVSDTIADMARKRGGPQWAMPTTR